MVKEIIATPRQLPSAAVLWLARARVLMDIDAFFDTGASADRVV